MRAPPDASRLKGKRVLVVEDEFLIAMLYEDLLAEHESVKLGPAATIERALELIESEAPDAALLDGNLHGRLSSPVAEALEARGVPFLLVTGYENLAIADPVLRRARRVTKPVEPETLVAEMVDTFR